MIALAGVVLASLWGALGLLLPVNECEYLDEIVPEPDVALGEPRCDCARPPPCAILGTHEAGSSWAKEQGVLQVAEGVTCDDEKLACGSEPLPIETLVETSESCGLLLGFYAVSDADVYIVRPQSVGASGGPGYALTAIEGADPESFQPLPRGFQRDSSSLFDDGTPVPGADADTFDVLDCGNRCRGCDARLCLWDCEGHPLERERFCWTDYAGPEGSPSRPRDLLAPGARSPAERRQRGPFQQQPAACPYPRRASMARLKIFSTNVVFASE